MSNRIVQVEVRDRSVIPAEAEIQVTIVPEFLSGQTEVRGQLVGPHCCYTNTVQVAYPFRPLLVPTGRPALVVRTIIPEANFWSIEMPHLYLGALELYEAGTRCDSVSIRHGLRTLSVGPRGLRLNGRLLRLRGRRLPELNEGEAKQLREAGYNLVLTEVAEATRRVWEVADSIGLLVLGQLPGQGVDADLFARLAWHPSCLGWLADVTSVLPASLPSGSLFGTMGVVPALPENACSFLAVSRGVAPPGHRPYLVLGGDSSFTSNDPRCLGVVEG